MPGSDPLQLFNRSGRSIPLDENEALSLLRLVEEGESCSFALVELVYVKAERMREINRQYLGRDYLTDIITFRYDEEEERDDLEGTLYCCAERIREQAGEYGEAADREFRRVFVHGLLHMAGYGDDTPEGREAMTVLEDRYLDRWEADGD